MAWRERLFHLSDLRSGEEAHLEGELLDRGADRRTGVEHFSVAVARDDLGRRHGHEPQALADIGLDFGVDVGVRADRPAHLAYRDATTRVLAPLDVALDLQGEERELRPVSRRLGMHAVRATDDRRVHARNGPARESVAQLRGVVNHEVHRRRQRVAECRVHNVGRGQPVVHPRAFGRPDPLLDNIDEGRGVVVGHELALVHRVNKGRVDGGSTRAQGGQVRWRDDPELAERFRGEELDLEHRVKAALVAEERRDVARCVPGNHDTPAPRAMSLRRTLPLKLICPAPS